MTNKKPPKRGLNPYYGEFLVSPIPLELSGNHCSHNCSFCFATLGQPGAIFDEKATLRLIENCESRKTLQAQLLAAKYPVLISNRSDPFAHSNYRQFVPLIRLLIEKGIPVSIQTRGGEGIGEVLSFLPKSVWYISINHDNDESRQKIERYAPTIESRLELVSRLRNHGHRVLVGVNPLVEEWIKDINSFLIRLKLNGVEGVWIETLHLSSHRQRANMLSRDREALGKTLIKKAMAKNPDQGIVDYFYRVVDICHHINLPVYSIGSPFRSNFFNPFYETYPDKVFPTTQGFLNHCLDNNISEFGFREWFDFMSPFFPNFESAQHSLYLFSTLRYNRRDCEKVIADLGRPRTFKDLLKAIWDGQKFRPRSSLLLGNAAFSGMENGRISVEI